MKFAARATLALATASLTTITTLAGAAYPDKPIRLVVPYPAGGLTDVMARGIAREAEAHLGQSIVIENKGGANGTLAAAQMMSTPPDGYVIGMAPGGVFRQQYIQKGTFDALKLTYVASLFDYSYVMAVRGDSLIVTVADLVKAAQARPDAVAYGSPGVFSTPHLVMDELGRANRIRWTHIPYKGGLDTVNALMGDQVQVIVGGGSGTLEALVKEGKIRVIATMGEARTTDYPNAPTLKESGFPLAAVAPIGIVAPPGLPPDITRRLEQAFAEAMKSPKVIEMSRQYGMPIVWLSTAQYQQYAQKTAAAEKVRIPRLIAEGVKE